MGSVNNGQQKISYDFRERGLAQDFNKLNYKLHPKGFYAGGEMSRVSDSEISIAPFLCFYDDETVKVSVRLETTTNAVISGVSSATPWIIGRFEWLNTDENYMDIVPVAQGSILSTDLIFGYVDYNGATMTSDFDYTSKSWSGQYYLNLNDTTPFKVIANEPYANTVIVQSGGPYFFNGRWIYLAIDTESPAFDFPISINGRKDIVAIDSLTNGIAIIKGADDNSYPEIDTQYLPVGIITFPPNITSLVKGNYIEYIHPNNVLTSKDTASSILSKAKELDGEGSGIDLELWGDYSKDNYDAILNQIKIKNVPLIETTINFSTPGNLKGFVKLGNLVYIIDSSSIYTINLDTDSLVSTISPAEPNNLTDIAYGNGVFMISGSGSSGTNKYLTSTDGISWTVRTAPTTGFWSSVAFFSGVFIFINANSTTYYTSANGITWTPRTLPMDIYSLSIVNNNLIGIDTGVISTFLVSPNGTSWVSKALPGSINNLRAIGYSNNKYLILAGNTLRVSYDDFVSWVLEPINFANSSICNSIQPFENIIYFLLEGTLYYCFDNDLKFREKINAREYTSFGSIIFDYNNFVYLHGISPLSSVGSLLKIPI